MNFPENMIQQLTPWVADQIAAGEVVKDPATALKELLENSLDAGSTQITVTVEEGGKTLLQVADNGQGMSASDLLLCFRAHATSKIKAIDDLDYLKSYGFRGEALHAIATAAARLEIMSRRGDQLVGRKIVLEKGEVIENKEMAMGQGTTIRVHHLFGNMPARLHFLKSNHVEFYRISDTMQRAGLSHSEVAFSLYKGRKLVFSLSPARLSNRIVHLLGKSYEAQLIPCQESTQNATINGYIGKPSQAKKGQKKNFFFVNGRFIKSPYLHNAIKKGFGNLLPEGTLPFYLLFIDVNPAELDVNIHPTKTEVRFEHEKIIYALVLASVRKALGTHHILPSIDLEKSHDSAFLFSSKAPKALTFSSHIAQSHGDEKSTPQLTLEASQAPYLAAKKKKKTQFFLPKVMLHDRYIITEVKSGLLCIDQKRARERIFYESHQKKIKAEQVGKQRLLFPEKLPLAPLDLALLEESKGILSKIGYDFAIEKEAMVIYAHPDDLKISSIASFVEGVLLLYREQSEDRQEKEEKWLRLLARRRAEVPQQEWTQASMDYLVNALFNCENPNYDLRGRSIWSIITLEDLAEKINGSH